MRCDRCEGHEATTCDRCVAEELRDGRDLLLSRITELEAALRLPLLFHGGGWDAQKQAKWKAITGGNDPSSHAMCEHIRKVLAAKVKR